MLQYLVSKHCLFTTFTCDHMYCACTKCSFKYVVTYRVKSDHLYLRNKSWKPECVGSFNMDWRILVFYPEPEARDKIY